jgi:hypothetical protein
MTNWRGHVHGGAPLTTLCACGLATLALLHLNHHHGENLGELSMLPRYLYHPVRVLGRRNIRATTANHRMPLQHILGQLPVPHTEHTNLAMV